MAGKSPWHKAAHEIIDGLSDADAKRLCMSLAEEEDDEDDDEEDDDKPSRDKKDSDDDAEAARRFTMRMARTFGIRLPR